MNISICKYSGHHGHGTLPWTVSHYHGSKRIRKFFKTYNEAKCHAALVRNAPRVGEEMVVHQTVLSLAALSGLRLKLIRARLASFHAHAKLRTPHPIK